jgi:hypothetical protein
MLPMQANFSIETQLEQQQMVFFKHNTGATSAITAEVRRTTAISAEALLNKWRCCKPNF